MSHYLKFTITERSGDVENDTTMVAEVPEGTSVEHLNRAYRAFLLDWYGSNEDDWDTGYLDTDGNLYKVWTDHQSLCWISDDEQLRCKEVFEELCEHTNNQSFNINACLTKTA